MPESMATRHEQVCQLTKDIKTLKRVCKNLCHEYDLWFKIWAQSKGNFGYGKRMLEFREWQKLRLDELRPEKLNWRRKLVRQLLIPKEPQWLLKNCHSRNSWRCRGDEGFDFCGLILFRMWSTAFAKVQGWKLTVAPIWHWGTAVVQRIISTISGGDVYGMNEIWVRRWSSPAGAC